MRPRRRAAAVLAAAVLAAASCRERGRPDPNIRMAISHERIPEGGAPGGAAGGNASGAGTNDVPNRLEVPPEVERAYSGVKLAWKDKATGKTGEIDVPLGGGTPLPDPTLVVRADVYLPSFSMGNGAITSQGVEEQNPAARITVFEKGKEIFGGWIFNRFPDVHPFENPKYSLRLQGGIPRPGGSAP